MFPHSSGHHPIQPFSNEIRAMHLQVKGTNISLPWGGFCDCYPNAGCQDPSYPGAFVNQNKPLALSTFQEESSIGLSSYFIALSLQISLSMELIHLKKWISNVSKDLVNVCNMLNTNLVNLSHCWSITFLNKLFKTVPQIQVRLLENSKLIHKEVMKSQ